MTELSDLFRILEINESRCQQKHNAIWEEKKRFTWWVSIIFPILEITYFRANFDPTHKIIVITLGSLLGLTLSILGYIVIRT